MRFAYLGSGSRGNGAVIQAGESIVLLDCGFSARETATRLARLGLDPSALQGVVVTHEHSDHISGVGVLARQWQLPVWLTAGTRRAAHRQLGELPDARLFDPHTRFCVGDIEVEPYPVPHDAAEPAQMVFSDGARRIGVLTDAGSVTAHMVSVLDGCDALALECNHDRDMLLKGQYPPALKARVGGDHGHLDNEAAAGLLGRLDTDKLQHVVAVHLSEKNNMASLAQQALAEAMGCSTDWIQVADQDEGLDWCDVL